MKKGIYYITIPDYLNQQLTVPFLKLHNTTLADGSFKNILTKTHMQIHAKGVKQLPNATVVPNP